MIMSMSKRKTIGFPPYGRLTLQDAKDDVPVSVKPGHIRRGKKNNPAGCALALAANATPEGTFPGDYLASRVNKTHTVVACTINNRVQARRFVHDEATRNAINGFDAETVNAFPLTGIVVTLLAPRGKRRAGTRKTSKNTGEKRVTTPRISRSVYRYHVDRVAAGRRAAAEEVIEEQSA
jgi:hypothetical protein